MTYEDLGQLIAAMTPEEQKKPALIAEYEYGETAHVQNLIPLVEFNGQDKKDQLVIIPSMNH